MSFVVGNVGDPVTCVPNESGTSRIQAITYLEIKSAVAPTVISITSADVPLTPNLDASTYTQIDTGNVATLRITATCDTAYATLSFVVALYDAAGVVQCVSDGISLTSGVYRNGSIFLTGSQELAIGPFRFVAFHPTALSAGAWSVRLAPY